MPPADRTAIDESLAVIQSADLHTNRDGLRKALANVAGIAAMVGQVGAPVIESIRKVLVAFGV